MTDLFTKSEAAAWGGLVSTHGRLFKQLEDNLRRNAGISHAEYEVLLRLSLVRTEGMRIQALAARSVLTHSGTSRLVDRLEAAGYVEKTDAKEDGRGAYVVITPRGEEHFKDTARHHVALVRELFLSHFSPEELDLMASFWTRVRSEADPDEASSATPRTNAD